MEIDKFKERIFNSSDSLIVEFDNEVFDEEFCLKHYIINKVIVFKNCYFSKNILFQYTSFMYSLTFKSCNFKGEIIFGDEDRNETLAIVEKDIHFNDCAFYNKVCFDGLICKGSLYFKKCKFLFKTTQKSSNILTYGLSISSSHINNSLNFEHSIFRGGLNLNACNIGIGLCLNHVKFVNRESSINCVASNLGIACEFNGGYYNCSVIDFDCAKISSHLNFSPKELFQIDKTELIKTTTNTKRIKRKFSHNGVLLGKNIKIDFTEKIDQNDNKYITLLSKNGYYILFDCEEYYNVFEGVYFDDISKFDISYSKIGNKIGFYNVRLKSSFIDFSNIDCRDFKLADSLIESTDIIDFRHSKLGWIFDSSNSVLKTQSLTFNGLNCSGGIFLRNTQLELIEKAENNSGYPDIDLSFCTIGKNIHFNKFSIIGNAVIMMESARINDSLIIEEISSDKDFVYIYLCDTQTYKFVINEFKNIVFNFEGFRFSIYHENNARWDKLVKRQVSDSFVEDIYIQFEKYFISKGDILQSQKAYYKGRCANRKTIKPRLGIRYITDAFLKYSVGYGVKNYLLLFHILIIIACGAYILFKFSSNVSMLECFLQSTIYFIPISGFKDIIIGSHITPNGVFNAYFIFHKIIGFILIPFYFASLTGFVKKRMV